MAIEEAMIQGPPRSSARSPSHLPTSLEAQQGQVLRSTVSDYDVADRASTDRLRKITRPRAMAPHRTPAPEL